MFKLILDVLLQSIYTMISCPACYGFFFFFMGLVTLWGQNPLGLIKNDNMTLEGFSYPLSFGEEHSSFLINYDMSNKLDIQSENFYDTYVLSNRYRTVLLGKFYPTERLYLFSGLELEREAEKYIFERLSPRVGFITGAGYEFQENIFIEARSNLQLNNSKMGSFGEPFIPTPRVHTLGGKFKF